MTQKVRPNKSLQQMGAWGFHLVCAWRVRGSPSIFSPGESALAGELCVRTTTESLARSGLPGQIIHMATPILDFSHLTPAERIGLAEQLWDSLEPQDVGPTAEQVAELRRRRAELEADGDPGEPADRVLDEIAERGE